MTREIVRSGGVGVVSVTAHLAGDAVRAMVDAAVRGDDEKADRLDASLSALNTALFAEPNPMPLKGALNVVWGSVGEPRLPLIPASDETVGQVTDALKALVGE
jgi:4-hydroxy-tetrahydrodipicolinate synthase